MFGGVLNSLTRKLGQTATKGEAGKLAGLIGGEGAIAKSAPKTTGNIFDKLGITKSLDNDLPIYHGTSIDNANSIAGGGLVFDPAMRNNLTGMGNYGVSTSLDEAVARKYAQQYGNKDVLSGSMPKGTKVLDIDSGGYGVDDYLTHNQLKELQDAGYGAVIDRSAGQEQEARLLMDFLRSNSDEAVPKAMPKRGFKDELEKLRGEVFDALDDGDYMYDNPDLESLVSNLGKERGFGLSYDDGWDNYVVGMADKKMPIDVASKNMSELANEYGFKMTANPDGTYRLYHGTNKKAADSIKKGGFEDGRVYLSPSKDVEYGGVNGAGYYGDNILDVDVDPRDLMFNPSGEFYLDDSKLARLAESVPEEAMAYLGGGAGGGNDLLKYMNATNPEFVAKKNLGAKTKTPDYRGRPTNEIRDSIAGTKIHSDDMEAMDEFIRYARNKKLRNSLPDDRQAKYEMRAYDMAEHYGIKLNENATDPIRDMANRFIKAMDKQNLGGK